MNYHSFPKSYLDSKIDENSLTPTQSFKDCKIKEGCALIQIYDLNSILKGNNC